MDSCKNFCSVIQYYKKKDNDKVESKLMNTLSGIESQSSVELDLKEILTKGNEDKLEKVSANHPIKEENKGETSFDCDKVYIKHEEVDLKEEPIDFNESNPIKFEEYDCLEEKPNKSTSEIKFKIKEEISNDPSDKNFGNFSIENEKPDKNISEDNLSHESSITHLTRGKKRKLSSVTLDGESPIGGNAELDEGNDDSLESDADGSEEAEKPRRRGRKKGKRSTETFPSHLSSDMVLGYKMLIKFLETPQFSGFHRPLKRSNGAEEPKITCLNQIKTKFEEKSYNNISEFVKDIREMLINIYESRNSVAIKRALRLEQVLEQRIAQLPNYLRPQCALVLSPDETNNSHNKIRISKGGGFVSLLLEKTEKQRYEKNKEKRKILAEERKQLKEEQDKDVQEWEKNVLLKDFEEDIKSMWELPAIGQFIHLCADILNIGEVAQFEVERMLLMPQCSDTLDLIMTALLTNSLMRAKLDRTPSMPYSIWSPLVRTRVMSWYRMWHKEGRDEQKLFEEIGIEPKFWQILGPDFNPLEYCYFHEISLFQRVWVLKTLCDVDFIRKKTVHDNIRGQSLDELNPVYLGIDRHGNRYIQLKQFCASDVRIYRQAFQLEGNITMSEYVDGFEGFEHREGPIIPDKVFRDIWEMNTKMETKNRKKKVSKTRKQRSWTSSKVIPDTSEKKNLRKSVRTKQKTYVDWSDSDQSDTDLHTLKKKLSHNDPESLYRPFSDKEFISLSVFRLPRDKITKPNSKKSGYIRKNEDANRSDNMAGDKSKLDDKVELDETKEDAKSFRLDDEQSDSLDAKQMQDMQTDFEKNFQGDDINDDEFDLDEKLSSFKLDKETSDINFAVHNLENMKVVFKKEAGSDLEKQDSSKNVHLKVDDVKQEGKSEELENKSVYKYNVPDYFKPDSSKFYLVVDSVESLRQLISKFGSHENDLEIITRSTKAQKKKISQNQNNRSCEVELIERLQNLLLELEPWEFDFMKSQRSNKEKMYREYMNFINRPPDFIHPNQSYWMKTCEEPASSAASSTSLTTTTTTSTVTSATEKIAGSGEKNINNDVVNTTNESLVISQQDNSLDGLLPRRRTRVTRLQLQPEDNNDSDEDYNVADDYESNESDDNWVLPTSKKKSKKETTKALRISRRSGGRRTKASSLEKSDCGSSINEKPQNSSPEKNKKALFWGPRSSDPSEDLNWEKNRQKILEQHNSPVKKNLYTGGETTNDMMDVENTLQLTEKLTASVITASPKFVPTPIPGNKKPYFSSAQLKAMENQAKHKKHEESDILQQKPGIGKGSNVMASSQSMINESSNSTPDKTQELLLKDCKSKAPVKIQTYSRSKNTTLKKSSQLVASLRQPTPKQVAVPVVTKIDAVGAQESIALTTQMREQIQNSTNLVNSTQVNSVETIKINAPASLVQQKGGGQFHIQIQQPTGQVLQGKTIAALGTNLRMQQPIQWQPKVITLQPVNQQGKVIQQQIQSPTQVPLQNQSQLQLQNHSQVQGQQVQQIISAVQMQPERTGTLQQVVISQPETLKPEGDLYVTDGKLLMKFDDTFVQQYLSKNKTVAVNVNDKLDLKKPLLIVKPKLDSNSGPGPVQVQGQQSTNSSNVVVVNKPVPGSVQHTATPSSVQNIVIPASYIIKDNPNAIQTGQQNVKIVQQAPTYIIQQKAVAGKSPQSQIIKIVTSQPMTGNPSLILNSSTVSGGNQAIRPVSQNALEAEQQTKSPTTIRFLRPQISTSVSQNKISTIQNPIIMNNIIQIQGQDTDTLKSQVVTSKILSSATPTVRLAAPIQSHVVVPSSSAPHSVKLSAQPLKVVVNSSTPQVQTPTSVTLNPEAVRPMSVNTVRLPLGSQHPGVLTATSPGLYSVASAAPVRVVTSSQEPTILATINPQRGVPGDTGTQALRVMTSAQPLQVQQPQAVETSANPSQIKVGTIAGQSVRLATLGQAQTLKLITNSNLGPRLIRQGSPGKVTVITAAPQSSSGAGTSTVRPTAVVGQPMRLQTVVQSTGSSSHGRDQT